MRQKRHFIYKKKETKNGRNHIRKKKIPKYRAERAVAIKYQVLFSYIPIPYFSTKERINNLQNIISIIPHIRL